MCNEGFDTLRAKSVGAMTDSKDAAPHFTARTPARCQLSRFLCPMVTWREHGPPWTNKRGPVTCPTRHMSSANTGKPAGHYPRRRVALQRTPLGHVNALSLSLRAVCGQGVLGYKWPQCVAFFNSPLFPTAECARPTAWISLMSLKSSTKCGLMLSRYAWYSADEIISLTCPNRFTIVTSLASIQSFRTRPELISHGKLLKVSRSYSR